MEKVKIKTCVNSGKTYQDKPIIEIVLEDGRKGSAFDTSFLGLPVGQEIEIDVKPGKVYNNVQQYYFSVPAEKKQGKFQQKDWTLEKRKISLENAVNWCKSNTALKTADVITCADAFFNYLNRKES